MPLTPSGARTFLHAMSDFWSAFFRDRAFLDAYADALSLSAAQLYQKLLEATLGMSLKDMPLYDRAFFMGCSLREDLLRYREGETPDEDTFLVQVGDGLAAAEYLANRIIAPTAFLTSGRDFTVEDGSVAFRRNPFDDGAGGSLPYFPVRVVQVTSPCAWSDPLGREWAGALPGDSVRVRVGGSAVESPLTGVVGAALHLGDAPQALRAPVTRRGAEVVVLRTPYDGAVVGASLSAHPTDVHRVTSGASDATAVDATNEFDLSGEPSYAGAWAPSTAYAEGSLVDQGGTLRRARSAHTSGVSFDAALWDDLGAGYLYASVDGDHRLDGLYAAVAPSGSGRIQLSLPAPLSGSPRAELYRVTYVPDPAGNPPRISLPHTYLRDAGFSISARRAVARSTVDASGATTTHAQGEAVVEGVDYLVDRDAGVVTVLSAWDPRYPARASYGWRLAVARRVHAWRGAYATAQTYAEGDLVLDGALVRVVRVAHTSDGVIDDARYATFREPVAFDAPRDVREIGAWATDALLDKERLYRVFGSLLDRPRATSEAYRVFLRAVSRLFLLGPTFDRFESALNAVAGLPLVRDDGEVLTSYSDGVVVSGADGALYGMAQGHDGALVNSTSRFSSARAPFLSTDVGAALRVVRDGRVESYVVSSYVSPTTVVVSPAPTDGVDLQWDFRHPVLADRLRVLGGSHRFTEEDVGSVVLLSSPYNAHNRGAFRVVAIDDPLTAVLDTEFGFVDESTVSWRLSRTGLQRVTTSRATYDIPLGVPMRADVADPASAGSLTFAAFEALTEAFVVVDYLEDPSWWHRVTVPEELMPGPGSRRTVTPELVEHVYGALDGAQLGDEGLYYGRDDEGRESPRRAGEAVWYGGDRVVLAYAPLVPGARPRDVGQHLAVRTDRFRGYFKVLGVEADGVTLRLDRFPPPEADRTVAPVSLSVELPPLVYRRTVAFVLMDRRLKYHSVQVRVDPSVGLSTELLEDTLRVVRTAKPSHVFVFFETLTTFRDEVPVEDEIVIDLDHHLIDPVRSPDARSTFSSSGLLRYGDCYRFVARSTSFTPTPGAPQTLPTTLPLGATAVRTLVKVAFDTAARVGSRRPVEGEDYVVDYVAGTVTVNAGVTITPSPATLFYVDCIRRVLAPGDPHDPGETGIAYGGSDPTFVRASDQGPEVTGLVDRAVQLTLGP